MASPKSDDDVSGGQPKLGETDVPARPGVYVQVSNTPRKKKSSSSYKALESGNHAVEETRPARAATQQGPRANPGPLGMGSTSEAHTAPEPRSEPAPRSQSEVRERTPIRSEPVVAQPRARAARIVEINDSSYEPSAESENTNYRADMVRVSARPPSMAPERLSAASVLDARPTVRSEPPAPARTPWGMIALVSVMSAIITAAGVVALQEWMHEQENAVQTPSATQADAPPQANAPAPMQPAAVPAPAVPEAVAAEAAPAAPSPEVAPSAVAAKPAPVEAAASAPQAEPPVAPKAVVQPAPVAPAPVAAAAAPDAAPVVKTATPRATGSVKRPAATEPAKPSLAFRKPPESWGKDEPAAPGPVDTAAIPSNPYAGDAPGTP